MGGTGASDGSARSERVPFLLIVAPLSLPVALMILAPLAGAAGLHGLESASRAFFERVCHRQPERSFTLLGSPLAVCARCTGVYAGLLIGALLVPWLGRVPEWLAGARGRITAVLLMLPGLLHPLAGKLGLCPDTPAVRVSTACLAAFVAGVVIVPALIGLLRAGPVRLERGHDAEA